MSIVTPSIFSVSPLPFFSAVPFTFKILIVPLALMRNVSSNASKVCWTAFTISSAIFLSSSIANSR